METLWVARDRRVIVVVDFRLDGGKTAVKSSESFTSFHHTPPFGLGGTVSLWPVPASIILYNNLQLRPQVSNHNNHTHRAHNDYTETTTLSALKALVSSASVKLCAIAFLFGLSAPLRPLVVLFCQCASRLLYWPHHCASS